PASMRSLVYTIARQDSHPEQTQARPTAGRAESRSTPAETVTRRHTHKEPADRLRRLPRSARDRQAPRREGLDLRADRSARRFRDARQELNRASRHTPDRSSTGGAQSPQTLRPTGRHAPNGPALRRSGALPKRPPFEQAPHERSDLRV